VKPKSTFANCVPQADRRQTTQLRAFVRGKPLAR
jgi:hypothetical protein